MKLTTTADIHDLMESFIAAAALGTALELGLFWRLAEQPQTALDVAQALNIPLNRCCYWLELLAHLGLLQYKGDTYAPSTTTRSAILEVYSPETWAYLAQEWRERFPAVQDLAPHIDEPGSVWTAQGLTPPRYFAQLMESPQRARRFTRMLYELHQPLADELAQRLDVTGVQRLMDLGGGSGVMSLALLRQHPHLTGVVVDIENVCVAGREIAAEQSMAERLAYHAADFLQQELPAEFDLVLECDVGIYSEALFLKMWTALNPGGRLVIVDQFAPAEGVAPTASPYLNWAFLGSLTDPDFTFPTTAKIQAQLRQAGFQLLSESTLSNGWLVIEARRRRGA